jgi:phosphomannomutase
MEEMARLMASLRAHPPTRIASLPVQEQLDFASGRDGLPPTDMLLLRLDQGIKLIFRPSGTEPKLKIYASIHRPAASSALREEIARCDAQLSELAPAAMEALRRGIRCGS